jgi:hypothetical protein
MPQLPPANDYERTVFANVLKFGWHCTHVSPTTGGSSHVPFTYTVGLHSTYSQPEFIILGMESSAAYAILNDLAEAARLGKMVPLDRPSDALVGGVSCAFVPVPKARYNDYVYSALWYHAGSDFPLFQAVWPDPNGCYPWNRGVPADFLERQPVIALAP